MSSRTTALALLCFVAAANALAAQSSDPPRVWPDEGPLTWTPRPTQPEITPDDLRTHVYLLAADSMRGRAAGSRGNFLTTEYVAEVFRRLGLEPAGDAGTYFQDVPPPTGLRFEHPSRNVIAVLRGSDPALRGQYVLAGAHNDHEGMVPDRPFDHDALRAFNRVMRPQGANDRPGQPTPEQQARIDSLIARARSIRPPRADSVMNGADDDASGTAVLLEIAERFATGTPPRRSIVFISHAAEEGGLLGSRYFTDNPTIPLDSIVAAHNMDMVGNGGVDDVKFGGPAQVQMLGARRLSQEFGDVIDSLNAVRDETMAIDYSWDRTNALNRFCRSDQVNYFRHTIPVTYFSTGYSIDYHQATDEPQYLDYEHSARVGRFVHEIMSTVANRPTRLRVLPPEERDMSAQCGR
ncbi:MAG: M20/M25/M40 family metallo-hydrolase [Gemmatimonadales bacterium]